MLHLNLCCFGVLQLRIYYVWPAGVIRPLRTSHGVINDIVERHFSDVLSRQNPTEKQFKATINSMFDDTFRGYDEVVNLHRCNGVSVSRFISRGRSIVFKRNDNEIIGTE